MTTTPVDGAAAAGVRGPPVAVRVRPPALLGRDLPEVRVATPEVKLDTALPQPLPSHWMVRGWLYG
jgi:hypothetical protein